MLRTLTALTSPRTAAYIMLLRMAGRSLFLGSKVFACFMPKRGYVGNIFFDQYGFPMFLRNVGLHVILIMPKQ